MIVCGVPAFLKNRYGAGNWKDIQAFSSLLRQLGTPVVHVDVDYGRFDELREACGHGATDVIVHYSSWPEFMAGLRRSHPDLRIHVRTHNAEMLQHWHRAKPGFLPSVRNLKAVYGAVRLLASDTQCRRMAHSLLGISSWDDRHYWARLPGKAEIHTLPYHSPWPELRAEVKPLPWAQRDNSIVCLAGQRTGWVDR